jgi:putative hydrolase of the HAD superfamily
MLQRLSEQYNIGVISNTQDEQLVHELLKKSGAEPYLDVVVTSVEHGTPKPDASIFQRALDMLGCKASEALFVGDSYVHDYVGATNAGLKALLIASTAESRAPRHDTITSVLDVSNYMSLVTAHEEASS